MTSARPFRLLGVQQIAIGAIDRLTLRPLWVDLLGLTQQGEYRSTSENVDEEILSLGVGPLAVEVDLMQPIDAAGRPRVHQPPLNHVGFWVDDLQAAFTWLTSRGVRFAPGGIRRGASGHDVCFIHPQANDEFPFAGNGVLIELVQAPSSVIQAASRPSDTAS
jgi:lactoylglutathione lyase